MNYEVVISEAAEETFQDIRIQIENRWGAKYADRFEERVVRVLEIISSAPFAFKSIVFDVNIRKAFIHRNCSMFYEIDGTIVTILFFWDNRQDPIFL
jgi:plasmid stabilization system protein ParE